MYKDIGINYIPMAKLESAQAQEKEQEHPLLQRLRGRILTTGEAAEMVMGTEIVTTSDHP